MRSLGGVGGGSGNTPTLLMKEMTEIATQDEDCLGGKALYFNVNCEIAKIFTPESLERQMFYLACPTCKKKVIDDGTGYRCENCYKTYEDAVPTYNFSMAIQDHSEQRIVNCLGEVGEAILGMKCNEFYTLHEDLDQVKQLGLAQQWKQLTLTIRAKFDANGLSTSQDEGPNIRYSAIRAVPTNFKDHSSLLLKRLNLYAKM